MALLVPFTLLGDPNMDIGDCHPILTPQPPFWVSDADSSQRKKIFDFFKPLDSTGKNISRNNIATIPRGTIVYWLADKDLIEKENRLNKWYCPVQVIAPFPKSQRAPKENSIFSSLTAKNSGLPEVKAGDEGYVYCGSMQALDDEDGFSLQDSSLIAPQNTAQITPDKKDKIFVITKESPFFNWSGGASSLRGKVMRLKTRGGQYVAQKCTDRNNPENFQIFYTFEILSEDLTKIDEIEFNPNPKCFNYSGLLPVSYQQYGNIQSMLEVLKGSDKNYEFSDLTYWDSRGFTEIPAEPFLVKVDGGRQLYARGPHGSLQYVGAEFIVDAGASLDHPEESRLLQTALREFNSSRFMKTHSANSFVSFLKEAGTSLKRDCPACPPIQWGDTYWPHGDRHKGHFRGTCVDIRPIRKDHLIGANTVGIDEKATKILLQRLKANGATKILFDQSLEVAGVKEEADHKSHIHACFPKE